jgi:hypothetical protein
MKYEQLICLVYSLLLFLVAATNYIPGLTDSEGLAFGIFALDPFDDALHLASGVWALAAGLLSLRSSRIFLVLFGIAYLCDGLLGILTGWGYLDFGVFTNASLGLDLSRLRIAANLPHIVLGGFAVAAGLFSIVRRGEDA